MKLQFAVTLKDRHGEDIVETHPVTNVTSTVTLGKICCVVLDVALDDDKNDGISEPLRRWDLMTKITKAEKDLVPLDLPSEDIAFIKGRLCKMRYTTTPKAAAMVALETAVPE